MTSPTIGIVLANIGTPDAPTPKAVKRYLKQFLSDRRVIEASPLLWQPLLRLFILPFRPKKSAEQYEKIWTEQGSPLLKQTVDLANALEQHYAKQNRAISVVAGMRYGKPSIDTALNLLKAKNIEKIIVLPMFPQYSGTTTASTIEGVAQTLKTWRHIPQVCLMSDYHNAPSYIHAIAESIRQHWQKNGKKHLLMSFHGIPQRYVDLGDPYAEQCKVTAKLITNELQLAANEWTLAFQSRLGPTQWLTPYTDKVLEKLPSQGIKEIDVICPGFSVDCLETLEEIAIRGNESFMKAGGTQLTYIPALNSNALHIEALSDILKNETTL